MGMPSFWRSLDDVRESVLACDREVFAIFVLDNDGETAAVAAAVMFFHFLVDLLGRRATHEIIHFSEFHWLAVNCDGMCEQCSEMLDPSRREEGAVCLTVRRFRGDASARRDAAGR